jgi:hypothetical protein
MIQIYDNRIKQSQGKQINTDILAGQLLFCGIVTEQYACLCQQKQSASLRLEHAVMINPCDNEENSPVNQACWERVREIVRVNPATIFFVDSYGKPYRARAIGQFPNIRYIDENTPDATIDELLDLGKKRRH